MSIKLVAFDVDGTLLRGQTFCECIAAGIGKQDEMRAFEQLTSVADIVRARATMISWYRSYDRASLIEYLRSATLAKGAREGVARLKRHGVQVALLSITWQFAVEWLRNELGADFAAGTRWRDDEEVDHFWPENKAEWLADYVARMGLRPADIVAVGDSAGDLPMLRFAGAGYYVGRHGLGLPSHVKHWPEADIAGIVTDLVGEELRRESR
jgi:HAD superfamily phosphoserine phosphatase-like hydrolase